MMLDKSKIDYQYLEDTLLNTSGEVPLAERFRALFTLKNIGDKRSIDIAAKAFTDDSDLLKHEVAYCIGQTGNHHAKAILENVLSDLNQHVMVRHEAAEAMGALGFTDFLLILEKYSSQDPNPAIVETCTLAIDRIKYYVNNPANKTTSVYSSVDPAPPSTETQDVKVLVTELIDPKLSLFKRYRAMFALREIGTTEAVLALCEGLDKDNTSALFRHEVAYVLGQMQDPASVPALSASLRNPKEVHMVRHEAAEALGSIASPEVFEILDEFKNDPEQVVAESCIVALDMFEYENSDAFQYADGLEKQNMHSLKLATGN